MRFQKKILYIITMVLIFLVILKFILHIKWFWLKEPEIITRDPSIKSHWNRVKILTHTLKQFQIPKTILLWTTFFGAHDYVPKFSQLKCPINKCRVTSNRRYINQSDALIFHLRDINMDDIPIHRKANQYWILLHHESPHHTPSILKFLDNIFNWTATYRFDSEILLTPLAKRLKNVKNVLKDYAINKTKMIAWLVSNCKTPSNREGFVEELKKHIPIDIYGNCGQMTCLPKMSDECYAKLGQKYRYYLSLENSICKDYVTEKFYHILNTNMIPIVMGGANYSKIAPPNSYIDALSFKTPKKLVQYLYHVANDSVKYNSYFSWKNYYEISIEHYACQICRKLHDTNIKVSSYENIYEWWFHDANCKSWSPNMNSSNVH